MKMYRTGYIYIKKPQQLKFEIDGCSHFIYSGVTHKSIPCIAVARYVGRVSMDKYL